MNTHYNRIITLHVPGKCIVAQSAEFIRRWLRTYRI